MSDDVCFGKQLPRDVDNDIIVKHVCCTLHSTCLGVGSLDVEGSSSSTHPLVNATLLKLGLPLEVCQAVVNPGFSDPFDVSKDITLDNPAYRLGPWSLMTGKLDWALLWGLKVKGQSIGNHDYSASDHKWLLVEVEAENSKQ